MHTYILLSPTSCENNKWVRKQNTASEFYSEIVHLLGLSFKERNSVERLIGDFFEVGNL